MLQIAQLEILLQMAYLTPAVVCVCGWGSWEVSSIYLASRAKTAALGAHPCIPEQAEGPWKHETGCKRNHLQETSKY